MLATLATRARRIYKGFFLILPMHLDLRKLDHHEIDISLPESITEELAEETGLHIGDGTMNFYQKKETIKGSYSLRGHPIDDKTHYDTGIMPLYKKLYDLRTLPRLMPSTGVYGFQKWSSLLVAFKHQLLGLPLGKKINICIPNFFIQNHSLQKGVIRGIFDTDGTIYLQPKYGKLYPRIEIGTISHPLALQLTSFLNRLGLRATVYLDKKNNLQWSDLYKVSVRGVPMLHQWIKTIEPHNPKHLHKYYYFLDHS